MRTKCLPIYQLVIVFTEIVLFHDENELYQMKPCWQFSRIALCHPWEPYAHWMTNTMSLFVSQGCMKKLMDTLHWYTKILCVITLVTLIPELLSVLSATCYRKYAYSRKHQSWFGQFIRPAKGPNWLREKKTVCYFYLPRFYYTNNSVYKANSFVYNNRIQMIISPYLRNKAVQISWLRLSILPRMWIGYLFLNTRQGGFH